MSIIKRADLSGRVVVSDTLLECKNCGHSDIGNPRDCPKCGSPMVIKQHNAPKTTE